MNQTAIELENFRVFSISYEKANAEIRGQFSFFPSQIALFSKHLKNQQLGEAFIISTCNRTELYTYSDKPQAIVDLFLEITQASAEQFGEYHIELNGENALMHLFRVSSGLESQILGDFEIVNQIKTWVKKFQKNDVTNSFLLKAVDTALQISKKIKSETLLSNGTASVSFAAVNYLVNSTLQLESVLLVGTGKIGLNTAENLVKHLPEIEFTLINRTAEKAEKLAKKLEVQSAPFSKLQEKINQADAVIVSTNADKAIIQKSDVITEKPMIFLDLSVPNNVSKDLNDLPNVSLLNVDDLSKTVDETLEKRSLEIPKAEAIIEQYKDAFLLWLENRKFAPMIKNFKENLDFYNQFHSKELAKNNIHINGKETVLAEKLAQKITNRLAHYLIENPEKAEETAALFQHIFHIENDTE